MIHTKQVAIPLDKFSYHFILSFDSITKKHECLERKQAIIKGEVTTMFDLHGNWESTTKEKRKELVHIMLQGVGVDVVAKRVLWVKAPQA
jgi:hypothetical protein